MMQKSVWAVKTMGGISELPEGIRTGDATLGRVLPLMDRTRSADTIWPGSVIESVKALGVPFPAVLNEDFLVREMLPRQAEHSHHTFHHEVRVAQGSNILATIMGVSPTDRRTLIVPGGLVHDWGKLPIPSDVLDKPWDKLTEGDKQAIRDHPLVGYRMLERQGHYYLKYFAGGHHQLGPDGGYPDRAVVTVPDSLQLFVNIIALIDQAESRLATDRPYREGPQPFEEALWQTRELFATQRVKPELRLDPSWIVRAFVIMRDLPQANLPRLQPLADSSAA